MLPRSGCRLGALAPALLWALFAVPLSAAEGASAVDAEIPTAPVTVDGHELFEVRGAGSYTAEKRAAELAIQQEESRKEIAQLTEDFSKLQNELTSLENELSAANTALNNAQTEADRKAARDRLAAAETRKAEAKASAPSRSSKSGLRQARVR